MDNVLWTTFINHICQPYSQPMSITHIHQLHLWTTFTSHIHQPGLPPKFESKPNNPQTLVYRPRWCTQCHWTLFLHVFFVHFRPNFTSHSLPTPFLTMLLSSMLLCLHAHKQMTRTQFDWYDRTPNKLDYWATDIPKQSCWGSSPSPGSCAGTSSAATERSHHSKFRTSRTRSTSRSASIAWILLVIDRFLASTAARSPQPTATIQRAVSSDLARDVLFPTLGARVSLLTQ